MTQSFQLAASTPFAGVYPILYAFFAKAGGVDLGAMRAQARACLAMKPHGLAVLGLATEVAKLSFEEKAAIVEVAAAETTGRVPLVVTVAGPSDAERRRLIRLAADHGAGWIILQPPPEVAREEPAMVEAFSALMDEARRASPVLQVAIQHAPQFLGVDLSNDAFVELRRRHPAFTLLKGEGSALDTAALIAHTGGELAVFAGRGGLEWPDMLRAGAAGLIPAPEAADVQLAIWSAAGLGDWEAADAIYRESLPLATFVMQSLGSLCCYGKRLAARRMGLGEVHDRAPAMLPTSLGLAILERLSRHLPPLSPES